MSMKLKFSGDVFKARKEHGWTQEQIAEAISVCKHTYQDIENGKRLLHTDNFLKLIRLFDLDANDYKEYFDIDTSVFDR